ncbi:histone-binding protein RBBP4 [Sporothrix schenckii 1099-18]|uniref:Histone acetyltransferase type B subunit 2 n=2 Tax=Sporothrix schenckii TaxID=29908 RepID=U7Q1G6_SPOS1|nr:histone-binding protein RBBP4 [Sporothrix schenckii 1099-18]ERT01749.1 histone acetyltransferase type B subunit 2 [Sporothrix schenckii ATCC 58251]KJR81126.1 histone-binding protein RBBP4 [Sporothrix schenckii 1099-18]
MGPQGAQVSDDVDVDMQNDEGISIDQEQRVINEEYKTWKKNSPFLYDMILSNALPWPTLTTQWFPDVKVLEEKKSRVYRLLLGTHTSEDLPNYLQIAEVSIPMLSEPNVNDYDEERGEIGGYGNKGSSGANSGSGSGSGSNGAGGSNGAAPSISFNIVQRIDHPQEVNKARYQPQNPDILATLCVDGRVLIFDRTKHSLTPSGTVNPQFELVGHKQEGFGLAWNPHEAGCLASGSEDTTVCLWDLKQATAGSKTIKPARRFTHHKNIVNDVQYHPISKSFLGSVSDDMTLQVVDIRQATSDKAALVARDGHTDAINALAFNPTSEYIVATASADKTIGLWDLRNVREKVHTLEGHNDAVTSLAWHPHEAAILGSGSYDRRIIFWDLSRVGEEQLPDDQEDGPPELLFMHGGHTNHLADFSWNPNPADSWLVCSAAEDNLLQIWKVADSIVGRDDADLPVDEMDR